MSPKNGLAGGAAWLGGATGSAGSGAPAGTTILNTGTGAITVSNGSAGYTTVSGAVAADPRYYFECKSKEDKFANTLKNVSDTDARIRRFDIDLLNNTIIATFGYFRNAEEFIKSLTSFNFKIENNWEDDDTDIKTYSVECVLAAKIENDRSEITECVVEFIYKEIN